MSGPVPYYQTFIDFKSNPPRPEEGITVEMIAQALVADFNAIRKHQQVCPRFQKFPRHSQGDQASPTAMEVATFIYPAMDPVAAIIQYERDVVVVAKGWFAQLWEEMVGNM